MGLGRRCATILSLSLFLSTIQFVTAAYPSNLRGWNFSVGIKSQYASLTRFGTFPNKDKTEFKQESNQSGSTWMYGLVFNLSKGPFFGGASFMTATFNDPAFFVLTDVVETEMAAGFSILPWLNPYFAYYWQKQELSNPCPGCQSSAEYKDAGPGLLLAFPVPDSRWSTYAKGELIAGFALEGGISYSADRWPATGVFGFSYRSLEVPAGEALCDTPPACSHERDIFSGPFISMNLIF